MQMKRWILAALTLVLALTLLAEMADARGRRHSHRVGGHNSHGKGSHYIGGY